MSETWWRNQQYRSALLPEFCAAQARNAAGAIRPPFFRRTAHYAEPVLTRSGANS